MYKNRRHPAEVECRLFCCPILLSRCRFCSFLKLLSYRHTPEVALFYAKKIESLFVVAIAFRRHRVARDLSERGERVAVDDGVRPQARRAAVAAVRADAAHVPPVVVDHERVAVCTAAAHVLSLRAIDGAFAADVFGARSRAEDVRLSDLVDRKADRHGDVLQVHPDQRAADVQSRIRANLFDDDGIFRRAVGERRERAARLGLRHDRDDLKPAAFGKRAFDHERAVQMFAALRGKIDAAFFERRRDRRKRRLRRVETGIFSDMSAGHLRRRTPDDEDLPGAKVCGNAKLVDRARRVRGNLLEHVLFAGVKALYLHENPLPFFGAAIFFAFAAFVILARAAPLFHRFCAFEKKDHKKDCKK